MIAMWGRGPMPALGVGAGIALGPAAQELLGAGPSRRACHPRWAAAPVGRAKWDADVAHAAHWLSTKPVIPAIRTTA